MKVCLVGGIFDRPEAVRSRQLVTPETVLLEGFRKAGVEVHAVGHAGFQPSDDYDIIHSYQWMWFESQAALKALAPGGIVTADDCDERFAFLDAGQTFGARPVILVDTRKAFGLSFWPAYIYLLMAMLWPTPVRAGLQHEDEG